ncbi:hypothetical protein Acor_24730 [Acrocarpospora corrugata]|uniref:Toxin n=1 Tax=Acrocarpospora corrugata TaxID=35763 RepID=A0A5M3VW45_9ACTN|nr:SpvB/TcaC N-terminal domain-containing protein [Acrocarpospora corrugata]GES00409.1 hypothetical protein Acor_24730 [Acrocarpospora corrugata]
MQPSEDIHGASRPAPSVSLPKGGGAIRGIGETFAANPATGTGAMTVPVATSPDRSGLGPELALSYDSGSGNGVFGFGWSLSLPSITRRTDRGLPTYGESDVFLLSGSEDLVPAGPDDTTVDPRYAVRRYRPRIDGLSARIERWTRLDGYVHWRSISRDNVLTVYGVDADSRIADPADPTRIFTWLISETRDDKGNAVRYGYARENGLGADLTRPSERNRGDRTANRYLKRVEYGNRRPLLTETGHRPRFTGTEDAGFMFEVLFDYGDHDLADPAILGDWSFRTDPFSAYRARFEVRTTRLCRRILTFHHVPGEGGYDGLVRSTDLAYATQSGYSFLRSVTQTGYRRDGDGYRRSSLPPLEFDYERPDGPRLVRDVDPAALESLPAGVGAAHQWVDLRGEGIPGILSEQADAWWYVRNLSPAGPLTFAPAELVASRPSPGLDGGRAQFMDLAGDGSPDLVVLDGPEPGLYEHDGDLGWQPFRPFTSRPARGLSGEDIRLTDLTGDGQPDVLVIEDDAFVWHPSMAEAGFGPALRVPQPYDEELGPRLVFTDGTQSIYLADFSGDGLTDLARIRNGEICYWPNLGYGRFGAKVTMDGVRPFDDPDQFDQRRVRLADIDGTGTTDLIYLHRDGVRLYYNRSGNGWSEPERLNGFPPVDDVASIQVTDLLGNGTACLVWSSPLPGDAARPMRYVRLTGERKPHLLIRAANNLGVETLVGYAPSTKFSQRDERDGEPWSTRLPFPVHVVEQVETLDRVSRNRFVSRYAYHHGHFDGDEREFRGFGAVDQWDTEEIGALTGAENEDPAARLPPVRTRTWFHTGGLPGSGHLPPGSLNPPPLPGGLTADEEREAHRALKGSMLRQEVYAVDGGPRQEHPYQVTETSYAVRVEQRRGPNPHAVFSTHPAETVERQHERDPGDPRVRHSITLDVDAFGNVLQSVTIGYGRRGPQVREEQRTPLITYTENTLTGPVLSPDDHRTPLPAQTRVFELTGYPLTGPLYLPGDFAGPDPASGRPLAVFEAEVGYHETAAGSRRRRPIEWTRVRYRADDLSALLPLGDLEPRALPGETYTLTLTTGLLDQVFRRDGVALLPDPGGVLRTGGYLSSHDAGFPADQDGLWWVPSGRVFLSPDDGDTAAQEFSHAKDHFFLPCRTRDPFQNASFIRYDEHDLLIAETRDAAGNRVTVGERDPARPGNDYRVLQPSLITDPNGNRTQVAFDCLGMVVATAVRGKPGQDVGDTLDGLEPDLTDAEIAAFLDAPPADPAALLGRATTRLVYDVFAHRRTPGQPAAVCTLARETHDADLPAGTPTRVQLSLSYSDGLGRNVQNKRRAGAGRWVVSGWTVHNNKGLPVRTFEPFFSATHRFESGVRAGVSPVVFYDPLGRVVATLHPDRSYQKSVFDPWRHVTWDANDTVLDDPRTDPDISGYVAGFFAGLPDGWRTWHGERENGDLGPEERSAAAKAAAHARTPAAAHVDVLGRPVQNVADNGPDPDHPDRHLLLTTTTQLDIEGNQRAVLDAAGRVVMRYRHDLMGHRIHQHGMDRGARWLLSDVLGQPLRAWDQRGHVFRTEYDLLRRPLRTFVSGPDGERLVERLVYGERHPEAVERNLRGVAYLRLDQAGALTTEEHDFKGNPLRTTRRLTNGTRYRETVGWPDLPDENLEAALAPFLETAGYTSTTSYDALDRPLARSTPHTPSMAATVVRTAYDEAGLVARLDADLRGVPTPFVTAVDYDALGRRVRIDYGNGATTSYTYDPRTFRLTRMLTTRTGFPADANPVQDLGYTYDPAGNLVHQRDDAQQRIFFAGRLVEPAADFTYDAIYRLIEATGREHLGQNQAPIPHSPGDAPRLRLPHPGDGAAMGRYTERYGYDAAGNILTMRHTGSSGWTRRYDYAEPSSLDGSPSDRLTSTVTGQDDAATPERYAYDAHGNATRMPHLRGPDANLFWDHFDQLVRSDLEGGGAVHYVYDADGERVRKVWEKPSGLVEERLYLGDFEIYRRTQNGAAAFERETTHLTHDGRRLAMIETRTLGTAGPDQLIRFQFGDRLGSARLELDGQARVLSYEEFTPYGSTSYQAVSGQVESPKRYRFTGKERDEETGLSYHGARYYAPWLGRWASCDPRGLADGTNLYRYAHDNPIGNTDPTGTEGTPILTPSGQPTPLTWIDPDGGAPASSIPAASLSGPSSIPSKAAKPAPPPPPPPPPPPAPKKPEFEPAVSDPEALRRAEGMGHIEVGDVVQFGKGLWNGPASWVGGPQFKTDEHYGGAAEVGKELGKNLVLEVATLGVGKAVEVATPFLRRAVRAPAFMFVGAGGPGAGVEAGRVLEAAEEAAAGTKAATTGGGGAKAAASAAKDVVPDVPTVNILPIDKIATRAGEARAPKVNLKPGSYRGVTKKMREVAQQKGEFYHGPGKYDVGHRSPLSQTQAGEKVRLRPESASTNRADGNAIAKSNEMRRKAGLYTRKP